MLREGPLFVAVLTILICVLPTVNTACTGLPTTAETTEKTPNGTVLFSANKTADSTITYILDNPDVSEAHKLDFQNYLVIEESKDNNSFDFKIARELDLEYFYREYGQNLITNKIQFDCGNNFKEDVFLTITAVNEFNPTFIGAPFQFSVPEDISPEEFEYSLAGNVTDIDVVLSENFFFYVNPFSIQGYGAEKYFDFKATSSGKIGRTMAVLDYDTLRHKTLTLNVSVWDGPKDQNDTRSGNALVNITVLDVDDQPPYFVYNNCPRPCIAPPYNARITEDYKGPITIHPGAINVTDPDTLGTKLIYSIRSGNEKGLFTMNQDTGAIQQIVSVRESGFEGAEIRLVIEVSKAIPTDLSAIAILTVSVQGRESNTTLPDIPETGQTKTEESGSSLLIPVVILGVLLALLITALVVVVLIYRRKQRQLTVAPDEKSEPQTEEEDLHTDKEDYSRFDSNEKLVFGNKTTLGIGTTDFPETYGIRGNALPPLPLRDSATETSEETKKKRARRRNKNKEPEIFDGTQEYNMGLDNEFYEAPDKSRVKRSQRSYEKKTDPALWIKVPNDQPVDDTK